MDKESSIISLIQSNQEAILDLGKRLVEVTERIQKLERKSNRWEQLLRR